MTQRRRVEYRCSFCGKRQEQVRRLIAGPGGVYICDECIELCREIITDELSAHGGSQAPPEIRPHPEETANELDERLAEEVAAVIARLLVRYEQQLRALERRLETLERKG